jgi:putative ATP-dependent endonuclease of OLD family
VKVIEFAQSGLKPLIKFARRMGIEWHVLVDGDEAGKKYAATGAAVNDDKCLSATITALPAMDMSILCIVRASTMFITGWRSCR